MRISGGTPGVGLFVRAGWSMRLGGGRMGISAVRLELDLVSARWSMRLGGSA